MKLLKLVPDNTNIKFLRWRVPFYAISVLLMAASLTLVFTKGLNFGVDFIGGQMVRMTFVESSEAPVAELREQIDDLGYGEPIIQQFGSPNEISIRMRLPELLDDRLAVTKAADLLAQLGDRRFGAFDERHADHLPADEVDAEVEALGRDQADRGRHQQQADDVERHPPAQELDVRVVGDELEEFHGLIPTARCRSGACAAASRQPTCASA